jgi:predicted DNA-binding transcriptional regulator YafY
VNRLERLYAVAEEIRRHSPAAVSASRLAERFDVSRRTMERDLVALRDAGVPIYASPGRNGGHSILRHGSEPRLVLTLTAKEATGLLMAATAAETAPYAESARAAARRLADALPAPTKVAVDELRSRIRTSVRGQPAVDRRVRRTLEEAVRRGLVVNLVYRDADDDVTERAVDAVGFYGGAGAWYLIGWCHLRQDRRVFRLDRITRASLTRTGFAARDVDKTLGWVPGHTVGLE